MTGTGTSVSRLSATDSRRIDVPPGDASTSSTAVTATAWLVSAIGSSAVSGLVDRLVEHGYVDRHEDPNDRRQQLVSLTPAGEEVLDRIREFNADLLRTLLEGMSPPELDGLSLGLAALDREARRIFSADSIPDRTAHERKPG